MEKNKKIFVKVICVLLLVFLSCFSKDVYGTQSAVTFKDYIKLAAVITDLEYMYDGDINERKLMTSAMDTISYHITNREDEMNEKDLINETIKSMVDSIQDPYTIYMDEKEYSDFNSISQGKYVGVGIQSSVKKDLNKIQVIQVFENSPAEKSGVKSGDYIIKVNNEEIDASKEDRLTTLLRGEEGSEVKMTIYRQDTGNMEINMKRATVIINTVTGEMVDDKIAYMAVSTFDENTSAHFEEKLKKLKSQNMIGLILDLRDNGGGLVNECINMVSNFIEKDKLIETVKGKNYPEKKHYSLGGDYVGLEMVILMNENTASASEMFIGAMKDYNLATIVGTKSFGKGIGQSVKPYNDGTALKITTSKFYTPLGNNIHGKGFLPDVKVEYEESLYRDEYSRDKDPQFQKALSIMRDKV